MVELIVLYTLCRSLGRRMREKGVAALWIQCVLVVAWFVGQGFGWFVGVAVVLIRFGQDVAFNYDTYLGIYLFSLVGGFCAAAIAFVGGLSLPSQTPQQIRRPGNAKSMADRPS